jgi:hypothetical protein
MDNKNEINQVELQQEDRILSYLQGKMSQEEESAFIEELEKDPDFKNKAISIARLAKGLSQIGEERDNILKESMLSVDEDTIRNIAKQATENMVKKALPTKFKYAKLLSIAASILLIVYLGFSYNDYRKTVALGEQYAISYEASAIRGDEQPDVTKELVTLINNVYNNNDLGATLKRLAVLWELSTLDTYNDYTNHAPEIGWALATGYLKDNNRDDAKVVLGKMAKLYEEDDAMGKKVRELIGKLVDL